MIYPLKSSKSNSVHLNSIRFASIEWTVKSSTFDGGTSSTSPGSTNIDIFTNLFTLPFIKTISDITTSEISVRTTIGSTVSTITEYDSSTISSPDLTTTLIVLLPSSNTTSGNTKLPPSAAVNSLGTASFTYKLTLAEAKVIPLTSKILLV